MRAFGFNYLESTCTYRGCSRKLTRRGSLTSRICSRDPWEGTSARSRPQSSSRAPPAWTWPSRSLTSRSGSGWRQSGTRWAQDVDECRGRVEIWRKCKLGVQQLQMWLLVQQVFFSLPLLPPLTTFGTAWLSCLGLGNQVSSTTGNTLDPWPG